MYKSIFTLLMILAFSFSTFAQNEMRTNVSTFDVVPLKTNGHYNGNDQKGGFWNGHFQYRNSYDTAWKSWSGIAVSNNTDTITNSYTNEYSSITGGGINGTKNYAVCYFVGTIISEKATKLTGFYVTNTTYTYRTIKEGSFVSKKFGGVTGNDKDWYRLKIESYSGGIKSDSLRFYLADFQNDDNSKDYVLNKWTWVDLGNFKGSDSLVLSFESSDVGAFGINTPTYVAIDDVNASNKNYILNTPYSFSNSDLIKGSNIWNGETDTSGGFLYDGLYFENQYNTQWKSWNGWALSKETDTSKSGFEAQYTAIQPTQGYAVSYGRSVIRFPYNSQYSTWIWCKFSFTNSTYPYKSMKYGDAFSKKFGGILGTDPDYLKVKIISFDNKNIARDTQEISLADYSQNQKFLLNNWRQQWLYFDNVSRLEFQMESSDNGTFGMNTPAYFCFDEITFYHESLTNVNSKMKVYPNPSSDYIIMDIQNANSYEIIDMTGKQFMLNKNPETNKIDISQLPNGMYCLKAKAADRIYSARFVKI